MTRESTAPVTPGMPPGIADLKDLIGESPAERVARAIDEIESQVALEDMVVVLIDTTREAARTFFDLVLQIHPQTPGVGSDDPGEGTR